MSDLQALDAAIAAVHEAKPLNPPDSWTAYSPGGQWVWWDNKQAWLPRTRYCADSVAAAQLRKEITDSGLEIHMASKTGHCTVWLLSGGQVFELGESLDSACGETEEIATANIWLSWAAWRGLNVEASNEQ